MCIVHPLDVESPAVFECAQAGCEQCVEALLRRHERLVHAVLRRQWRGEAACADLLQEGRIGLWQAILHFDPHRGIAFSTYAWYAIQHRMWRAVRRERRQRERVEARAEKESMWARPEPPNPLYVAEDALWWERVCATLAEMVAQSARTAQEVVVVYYGLDGGPPCTLAALGRLVRRHGRDGPRVAQRGIGAVADAALFCTVCESCVGRTAVKPTRVHRRSMAAWLGRWRRRKVR